ncbi:MAG: multiple sugar transport system permease protein [Rhodospirillaceae bacterium]|jgi:multiple sugar transport system permease protein|nr:multiple sugar transport system permease protein [Rhodospirillaceae bacterium]
MRRPSPVFWALLVIIAAVALFPYLWIVLTSFKARTDILTTPPVWLHDPNLINYRNMLFQRGFDGYLLNSIEIGLSSTLLALVVGTLAAYAFSHYRVPAGNHLFFYILATRLGPPVAYALPMYFLFSHLGLLKTHFGVILAHATFNLVLVVWMMKTFFDEIPGEVEEAARLDGCSEWQLFRKVSVPLALPGLVTAAIFIFIFSWNEMLFAMILSAGKTNTLPAMIPSLVLHTGTLWGEVAAAAVVQTIPVIIFTFIAQRHLIRGLTFGAVKG